MPAWSDGRAVGLRGRCEKRHRTPRQPGGLPVRASEQASPFADTVRAFGESTGFVCFVREADVFKPGGENARRFAARRTRSAQCRPSPARGQVGVLPQVLSLWEKGQRLPSVEDVSAILALLGVTGEKRDRIRTLARHAREPNWLASSNWDLPFALTTRLNLESTATGITTWWPMIVPGLLQTPD